jgi:hypothetical protein
MKGEGGSRPSQALQAVEVGHHIQPCPTNFQTPTRRPNDSDIYTPHSLNLLNEAPPTTSTQVCQIITNFANQNICNIRSSILGFQTPATFLLGNNTTSIRERRRRDGAQRPEIRAEDANGHQGLYVKQRSRNHDSWDCVLTCASYLNPKDPTTI